MEFLMDNYIWIMIICIVLLMALIGYIAEKQGFGTKENIKKEKKSKKEEVIEPIKEEKEPVEEISNEDTFEEPGVTEEVDDFENSVEEQVDDNEFEEESMEEESLSENNEEESDDNKDLEEQEEVSNEEEDLFVGLDGTPNAYGNQELNIDKDFNNILDDVEDSTEDVDMELPKVDSNELEEELEEDDIWKF